MGARESGFVKKITQDTLLPISLMAAIAYVIFLVGSGYQQLNANTLNIDKLRADDREAITLLRDISERLIRIETKIALMEEKRQ
jgi:hypothetical protein